MKLVLLIFAWSQAFALNTELPPELRTPAEHELREGQNPLGLEREDKSVAADYVETQATSIYRGGPHRTGVEPNGSLPIRLKMDWRVPYINMGNYSASKSSPAVDASGIYVGSDSSWFYSYDLRGHLRWRRFVPNADLGVHATAALDKDRVYFGAYNGILYSLRKSDGSLIWGRQLGDVIGSSAVIHGNSLYVSVETEEPNGFLEKINNLDGKVIWKSPFFGGQPHSSPVIDDADGLVLVGSNSGYYYGLAMDTGKIIWSFHDGKPIKDTGALIGHSVCFGSWSKKIYCLEASSGKKIWEANLDARSRTSPTYIPDLDYVITASEAGTFYAFRQKNGSLVWKKETEKQNLISSSLVIRDSASPASKDKLKNSWVIWDSCEKYFLCVISPQDGKVISRYEIPSSLSSVPVYFDGALYLSLDREGGLERFISDAN